MRQAIERWKCCECGTQHDDEDDARECCAPLIQQGYGCPECGEFHEDDVDAIDCCISDEHVGGAPLTLCPSCARGYGEKNVNHFAISIAGHCNTCNPFYTLEQQFAIEDQHIRVAKWNSQSLL